MTTYPCTRDCKGRYPGCHDHCSAYLDAKEKNNKEHSLIIKNKTKENAANAVRSEGYKRMTGRSKKSGLNCHKK